MESTTYPNNMKNALLGNSTCSTLGSCNHAESSDMPGLDDDAFRASIAKENTAFKKWLLAAIMGDDELDDDADDDVVDDVDEEEDIKGAPQQTIDAPVNAIDPCNQQVFAVGTNSLTSEVVFLEYVGDGHFGKTLHKLAKARPDLLQAGPRLHSRPGYSSYRLLDPRVNLPKLELSSDILSTDPEAIPNILEVLEESSGTVVSLYGFF